ncbi:MAG: ECF transporter S component [Oscillospiraceae bacterium]|nr:ECF transporter S component [Oscillospiraceae bacterium]
MENTTKAPEKGNSPKGKFSVYTIVGLGLLTAIVVVLQLFASQIRIGGLFSITLCLAPIAIGAALYGWKGGVWLGFAFGLVVMFTDTALFFPINPAGTIITVMAKGMLAGLAAGLLFKPLAKKSDLFAVIVCGVVVPFVNKAIFVAGCGIFFLDTVKSWASSAEATSVVAYLFFGMTGFNFLVELGVNLVLSTAIVRIIQLGRKKLVLQ